MAIVVARRRGSKPSLLSSMPASLFGKFTPNWKAETQAPKAETKPAKRAAEVPKGGTKVKKPAAASRKATPKKKGRR